ncbi:MAG: TIR domain-containing protein [Verrucomicrobia bacterium]|nr:TIR domain-containing protein [Verrucomicrobiota bacterium]
MPAPAPAAVFLSYASQDAAAAQRVCDALRAAGVEVWFDLSELRGGDAWDKKIRTQIRDCALFLPLISANTQSRLEGYFRLEWKLAEDRSHLMAKGKPFLVPVVVDDTSERDAHVPDAFLAVQWTRLPLRPAQGEPPAETMAAFCTQVQRLLGRDGRDASPRRPSESNLNPGRLGETSLPANSTRRAPSAAKWSLAAIAALAIAGYFFFNRSLPVTAPAPSPPKGPSTAEKPTAPAANDKSLAVLPFENLSPDPENALFTEGMHTEIISNLQLLSDLKVVSRGRALAFKGSTAPTAEIARQLAVAHVITGSVRREKDRVRITLELRRASDDALLWSLPRRDYELKDALALQSDIAEQVARVLQAREIKGGAAAVARFMTKDPRAYDLFVKVRKLFDDGTGKWAEAAAQCEAILELDPDFMLAATHLSFCRSLLATSPGTPLAERLRQATEAKHWAEAAARMVPGGAGDGALVTYYLLVERDGLRALAFAENQVRAMPNAAESHYQVARALQNLGRGIEAVAEYQRAVELDPSAAIYERNFCSALAVVRRVEDSRQAAARAVTKGLAGNTDIIATARFVATGELPASTEGLSGRNLVSWLWRGRRWAEAQAAIDAELHNEQSNDVQRWSLLCARTDVCARLGQLAEAAAAVRDALATAERLQRVEEVGPTEKPGWLAAALVRAGRGDEAIAAAKRAVAAAPAESHVALRWEREIVLAKIYAHAKRPRECVELLAKLLRVPSGLTVPMLKVDPTWDTVRDDPAFKALLADPKNSAPL